MGELCLADTCITADFMDVLESQLLCDQREKNLQFMRNRVRETALNGKGSVPVLVFQT